jgi:hypothetical protein
MFRLETRSASTHNPRLGLNMRGPIGDARTAGLPRPPAKP